MLPITLPINICCDTCQNYISKGTDVNFRKEEVMGETYMGAQIFRFHFKCTRCSAPIAIKPHPKKSDYVVESGATRDPEFEPSDDDDEQEQDPESDHEFMLDLIDIQEEQELLQIALMTYNKWNNNIVRDDQETP
ncbi:CWC16 protein [Parasponia andersonii]|uniref:CWC16 protein n=1 Tax=Parasponia andersonii TaxID=3476 RepID=A0A2P5DI94_PARAD|nr:CWC16 protein [Parasponia andersonii]